MHIFFPLSHFLYPLIPFLSVPLFPLLYSNTSSNPVPLFPHIFCAHTLMFQVPLMLFSRPLSILLSVFHLLWFLPSSFSQLSVILPFTSFFRLPLLLPPPLLFFSFISYYRFSFLPFTSLASFSSQLSPPAPFFSLSPSLPRINLPEPRLQAISTLTFRLAINRHLL